MTDDELLGALNQFIDSGKRGICVYTVRNDCPSGWGVTIATAGVNFYYKDGSSETVGPRNVLLTSGQSADFRSTKAGGCVKKCFLAMKVVVDGEGAQDMTNMSPDAPDGECYSKTGTVLAPKRFTPEHSDSVRVSDAINLLPE